MTNTMQWLIEKHINEIRINEYKNLILNAVKEEREVFFGLREDLRASEENIVDENQKTMAKGFDTEIIKLLLVYGEIAKLIK